MEDLLVIILTLGVALVGAFGRKKKRNTAQPPSSNTVKQPQDFWNMLMEQEHQPEPFVILEEEIETEEEELVVETVEQAKYQFNSEKEGKSEIKEERIKTLSPVRKKVQVGGENFSLRKAVIYSEILNRKYT